MKLTVLLLCCITFSLHSLAQEDSVTREIELLDSMDSNEKDVRVESAFKSPRVIMSHSIEMLNEGVLDFRILHRFGPVNGGIDEMFGMDDATMRLGLDYGLTNNFTIGIGRSTFLKEFDGYLKLRLLNQSKGEDAMPFSLAIAAGSTIRLGKSVDSIMKAETSRRMGYYGQLMIGRKFSQAFSLQLSPIFVHQNLVELKDDPNNMFALGAGARMKLTKRLSLNADYYYIFDPLAGRRNPLSIGFDIETGGHVFQLHFSNAEGMNERAFINETTNDWGNAGIRFGFNLSRVFQLKKKSGW
jgi:hypothetical protein